tara:strand:- start:264 stop:449 length:186 start_codon:yes stop_codon:yes gene_type:complete
MASYEIKWTDENWWRVTIEAENSEIALEKFWQGEYHNGKIYDSAMQDGVDIRLLDDEFEED